LRDRRGRTLGRGADSRTQNLEEVGVTARDDCIFCKIIAGVIPCTRVYEDDEILAFMDIAPVSPGHALVIPKEHAETLFDMDAAQYGRLYEVACRIAHAIKGSLSPQGLNVMQLNGKAGNQVVPHVHVHLVPRSEGDGLPICAWAPVMGDRDKIAATAELIKSRL
jgi:histidine triad (HIT) family protein